MNHRSYLWLLLAVSLVILEPRLYAQSLNAQLLDAAGKNDVTAAAALLAKGADVNTETDRGVTPLYVAAEQGYLEMVRLLLAHGANPDPKDLEFGRTALRHATIGGDAKVKATRGEILRLLLEKGAGSEGESLVDLIRGGHADAVRTIVGRGGVDPSYLNATLEAAKRSKDAALVDFLIKAGAKDPTSIDSPDDPERLKLLTGVYRNPSGQQVALRPGIHEDQLLFERGDRPRVALLPLDLMTVRSVDGKVVVKRRVGPLPPAELIVKDEGRTEVFARVGDVPLPTSTTDATKPRPVVAERSASRTARGGAVFGGNWAGFRGPRASGIADGANVPVTWDIAKGINVQWKTPIPGLAHSSPIVWGDRVFVSTAVSADEESPLFRHGGNASSHVDAVNRSTRDTGRYSWRVYALDRNTGKVLWDRLAHEGIPRSQRHVSQTQANSTPATDGRHLVVWFGSEGLFCYDFAGKLLWKKDLGPLRSGYIVDPSYEWNLAASPVIYKDRVILQVDLVTGSFIAAFDTRTGKEIWRTERDEVPSWTTPLIYEGASRTELITAAPNFARGYDPDTGKELWRLGKHSIYSAASPIAGLGLIFVSSGSGNTLQPIYAIRPGANGNITLRDDEAANQHVAWSKIRGGAYLPTPILYDDLLYVSSGSIVAAYRAETGERVYQERLARGGSFTASPVAADGKLYFASEDGEVVVVKAGPKFERLAVNSMGDVILASPAVAPGMIVFRTQHHVVAVAESGQTQ